LRRRVGKVKNSIPTKVLPKMRRYAFTYSWFRQCMSCPGVFILVYLLTVVFELSVAFAEIDNAVKKPIVIDLRTDNTSKSVDTKLYIVDGVLRHTGPQTNLQDTTLKGRHEIRTIDISQFQLSNLDHCVGDNNEKRLQIDSLLSMIGREEHDGFGISVAGVDDFNGDGYHDFVIGAPFHWGDVYLYFGGPEMDSIPDMEIHGDYSLGWPVASAGDVNADGFGDIIVGEPVYGVQRQGVAYIFFGGSLIGSYLILEGDQEELLMGAALAPLGDINGDGYDDVMVGTQHNVGSGRAYVFLGGAPMDTIPDLMLKGENQYDYFGLAVASAGDVNGDGAPDIIIGNGQIRVEKAYIYFGGALLDTIPDLILTGPLDSDFGWHVASAGDINGDGYDDVMVSAHWYTEVPGTTPHAYGRLYIYYGGMNIYNTPDVIIRGTKARAAFSTGLSTLRDINFDGYDDIVIGAFGPYSEEVSKARVFLGGLSISNVDTLADAVIEGEVIGDYFSYSLSGTHDVNGDGLSDIVVGADERTTIIWEDGKVYVYSVLPGKRGDINGDGKINAIDVVMLINIIIGRSSPPVEYELWAADIIVDKAINIEDVLEMVNLILEFQ
jgi:hypothetical protein